MTVRGLYPSDAPRPTSSEAEKRLWHALRSGLPDGWVAWHSMKVRTPLGQDGESDFVLAIPDRGPLVLEVKGGAIEVRGGRWYQDGRPLVPAPRDQAFEYVKKLKQILAARSGDTRFPYIAVATAFPDTEWDAEPTHGDVAGAVLGAQDLPYLRDALPALVARVLRDSPPRHPRWIEALHDLWGETWRPHTSLGTRTKLAEARRIQLDVEQLEALEAIEDNPRLFIAGGPGTGKTVVAREIARRWEARGRRPVLFCFTRALANELRASGTQAWTVREYAAALLAKRGIEVGGGAAPECWSAELWKAVPRIALEALPHLSREHDAVVVDEAQDLEDDDWALVLALAGDGPLWVLGDEAQSFWSEARRIPERVKGFAYTLRSRHRCPAGLAAFADGYRRDGLDAPTSPVEGLRVVEVEPLDLREACAREVAALLRDGVRPHQIAVLSLGGQTRTALGRETHIGGAQAVRADASDAGEHLVADTFLRFKGLERPWIVVTELGLGSNKYPTRMHIALTRATVGCIVLATTDELSKDERLRRTSTR